MNVILMAAMMAVALLFMHGGGHHDPGPAPEHHATKQGEGHVPSRERDAVKSADSEERGSRSAPDQPGGSPAPPPKAD